MASIAAEYYHLNFARRPEHMGLDPKSSLLATQVFSAQSEDDEAGRRGRAWAALRVRAEALARHIPAGQQDAFFQLLLYPVRGATLMNEKGLALGRNDRAAAAAAQAAIQTETDHYNDTMSGGKWRGMMSDHPHEKAVFDLPNLPPTAAMVNPPIRPHDPSPSFRSAVKGDFFEERGQVSLIAAHTAVRTGRAGNEWELLPDLGYTGLDIGLHSGGADVNHDLRKLGAANPVLEYHLWTETTGPWQLWVRTLPTWPVIAGQPQTYAVAIDDAPPVMIALSAYHGEQDPRWQVDVLRNAAVTSGKLSIPKPGFHRLRLWTMDAGIVFDSLLLQAGNAPKPGYLWPEETRR